METQPPPPANLQAQHSSSQSGSNFESKSARLQEYCQCATLLFEPVKEPLQEERVLQGFQEINEYLEFLMSSQEFSTPIIQKILPDILNYLMNGPKNFLLEHSNYLLRKTLLEILSRFPFVELRPQLMKILPIFYHILEHDNEENASVVLRIITEYFRKLIPSKPVDEVKKMLSTFRKMTHHFVQNANKILEPREPIAFNSRDEFNIEAILPEIFTVTVATVTVNSGQEQLTVLPRGFSSLKILSEIPVTCVIFYQLLKLQLDPDTFDIIRLAVNIISIQPTPSQLNNPLLSKELYAEFFAVQIKYLSLCCYFIKSYDDKVHSLIPPEKIPQIILNLFINCPNETPSLRKDLFASLRCIIITSYRKYFLPFIEQFLDDEIIIGSGWTTKETSRMTAYCVICDMIHHFRDQLTLPQIKLIINVYSKNIYDPSTTMMIHTLSCRLLLNIVESFSRASEKENNSLEIRTIFIKIFYLYSYKVRAIAKYVIPNIEEKFKHITVPTISTLETFIESTSNHGGFKEQNSNENSTTEQSFESTKKSDLDGSKQSLHPDALEPDDTLLKFEFPESSSPYTLNECRNLIKFLINALKILAVKLKEHSERIESRANNNAIQVAAQAQAQQVVAATTNGTPVPAPPTPNYTTRTGFCRPRDLPILIRLFKNGLDLFKICNISQTTSFGKLEKGNDKLSNTTAHSHQRTKEDKEMVESFSIIFISLAPQTFRAVMRETVEYFVECIQHNNLIQLIANSFLSSRATSLIFSSILVEFLIERMSVMGKDPELSNLYLRLFKLVFGSVSLFPNDNELMLKPHLHKIVNNSMKLALTAKEPYNYFQLLRALFRSIGGGSHDLLYQEFLPTLPSLLQGLNSLQSGIHRQNMKDLFVELCLTIPVRLSSLLPYLPWLMDPLVSALNGTQNLISQGLRTLELCVDNLQPDFLYEHIQPIRTELMQALWRTLRHPVEHIAQVSFRILGKLGGSNHKLMIEPQKLEWIDYRDPVVIESMIQNYPGNDCTAPDAAASLLESISPSHLPTYGDYSFVSIFFNESTINSTHPNQHTVHHSTPIHLPIDKVIETAYRGLCQPGTETFYRSQCWEAIKGFLVAHIQHISSDDEKETLNNLFKNSIFTTGDFSFNLFSNNRTNVLFPTSGQNLLGQSGNFYKFQDEKLRKVHEMALTAMITAAAIKELHNTVVEFMLPLVRHYTLVAICQQAGSAIDVILHSGSTRSNNTNSSNNISKFHGMDPLVLVDAFAVVMAQEERELCKPAVFILQVMCDTSISVLGSQDRASQLPLFEYIIERVCALCYERAWFSKYGGCLSIQSLLMWMPIRWIYRHELVILKAMLFVMMDLSGDLSSGVIDMAKFNLNSMIGKFGVSLDQNQLDLIEEKKKSIFEVTHELVQQLTSPNTLVREETTRLLQMIAKVTNQTVTEVMMPHKSALADMIPPRRSKLVHYAANVQIGFLDGCTFCFTLDPPLFSIDTTIAEHQQFFNDVYTIAESSDANLQKYSCYKSSDALVSIRKSCLRVLASCHHLPSLRTRIFEVLYKAVEGTEPELQECAFECLNKYKVLMEVDPDVIRKGIRNFLQNIQDYRALLNPSLIQRLKYLAKLFSYIFNDKFCEQMMQYLFRIIELNCVQTIRKWRERELRIKSAAINAAAQQQQQQQQNADGTPSTSTILSAQVAYEQNSKLIHLDITHQINSCAEVINLFALITAADDSYVEHLMKFLIKSETQLDIYVTTKFYQPIRNFFKRYPHKSVTLMEKFFNDQSVFRFFQFLISGDDGEPFRAIMYENPEKLITVLRKQAVTLGAINSDISDQSELSIGTPSAVTSSSSSSSSTSTTAQTSPTPNYTSFNRFQAIKLIQILTKYNSTWLSSQNELVQLLKNIWLSDSFHKEHSQSFNFDYTQWSEPKILLKCLLNYFEHCPTDIEILFHLIRAFNTRYHCGFEVFRKFLTETVFKTYSVEWKRSACLKFVEIFNVDMTTTNDKYSLTYVWSPELKARIMQYFIVPVFSHSFENGYSEELIGPVPPNEHRDNPEVLNDLITIFMYRCMNLDMSPLSSSLRLFMLQFCCLIMEKAPQYVKPAPGTFKKKDQRVRVLMSYPWQFLSFKNFSVDPANKYYAHVVLAYFIIQLTISKNIMSQVFASLVKSNSVEARPIVRHALDVMSSILFTRMSDEGHKMLAKLTRSILAEESNQVGMITNIMQIIVRNYKALYVSRHLYIHHMNNAMNRLGLFASAPLEQRKVALDIAEVIIRWEFQSKQDKLTKNDTNTKLKSPNIPMETNQMEIDSISEKGVASTSKSNSILNPNIHLLLIGDVSEYVEKELAESIIAFLIKFVCVIYDLGHHSPNYSTNQSLSSLTLIANSTLFLDYLAKRSLSLIKIILQTDLWPNVEYRILFIDRSLAANKENFNSTCMAIELLIVFLQCMKKDAALRIFISLQKAIVLTCNQTLQNARVVRTMNKLLSKLMAIFPPSCSSTTISPKSGASVKVSDQLEPLEQLYTEIHSIILNGFGNYDKATSIVAAQTAQMTQSTNGGSAPNFTQLNQEITTTLSLLFGNVMILKAACTNQPSYIDRLLTPFMHMLQKLVKEHLILGRIQLNEFNSQLSVDLIVLSLELVMDRLGSMSHDMRRAFMQNVFFVLIEKSNDVKVMKVILKIFEEWIKQPLSQSTGRNSSGSLHPIIREKAQLLTRISMNIEKRMADDAELNASYLELILYIYTDDILKTSDLAVKLEHSFMLGLRCPQPSIRQKFFNIMDNAIKKRLYDRLMYIICEQNWDYIGNHFWIKQCIELILSISNYQAPLSTPNNFATIPLPTSFVSISDNLCNQLDKYSNGTGSDEAFILPSDVLMDLDIISGCTITNNDLSMNEVEVEMSPNESQANNCLNEFFGNLKDHNAASTNDHRDRSGSVGSGGGPKTVGQKKEEKLADMCDFLHNLQNLKSYTFINAVAQLCHFDSQLAHHVWIQLFPRIYSILGEKQQLLIALQLSPFFVSGAHLSQRDAPISSIGTFFEAMAHCKPSITLCPSMIKYIAKNHNVWHRVAIMLENGFDRSNSKMPSIGLGGLLSIGTIGSIPGQFVPPTSNTVTQKTTTRGSSNTNSHEWNNQANNQTIANASTTPGAIQPNSTIINPNELFPAELPQPTISYEEDCLTAIGQIYELLREEDYWAGIWQQQAQIEETKMGIAYEQQGFFEQAKGAYELAMSKARNEFSNGNIAAPYGIQGEYCLWEQHWIRCSKELNQWDFLLEYGNSVEGKNPQLVIESAWRIPDWDQMNDAIYLVEQNLPKEYAWKCALYKGYNAICNPKHRDLESVQKMVDMACNFLIKEWRRLPPLVSTVHMEYLHAAHQVIELQEAGLLHKSIFNGTTNTNNSLAASGHERTAPFDLRAVIKTWKNRLPVLADDLSHWSDIFTWRQHHYQAVVSKFEAEASHMNNSLAAQNSLLGAHASAQSLIHYAKIARKHFLVGVSLDSLNRIHTIPRVPIIDCFQKIRQQLKCYLLQHATQPSGDELHEGLSVIESTHLKYFQKEMISEFYAMKGYFLVKLGQLEEANRTFSVATQIQDTLVKAWALWGEYFEELFTAEPFESRNIELAVSAITAYLHACRHQNEAKARKFLSKVLWLQSYDDETGSLAKATEKYNAGVPVINWLPWVPQLLQSLIRPEGESIANIVLQIAKIYPQAVYLPVRSLYMSLKFEQRENRQHQEKLMAVSNKHARFQSHSQQRPHTTKDSEHIQASSVLLRCTKIMHHQKEICPTVLTSLEILVDQLLHLRQHWYEVVLKQLRQALVKCYASAFEQRLNVAEATISNSFFIYFRKIISNFGTVAENSMSSNANQTQNIDGTCLGQRSYDRSFDTSSSSSDPLLKHAQNIVQDPSFHNLQHQFSLDFDFNAPNSRKLHVLIVKLKKWIKILETKIKVLPKSWLLEEKCRFLSNFSHQTVDIALPGEFLLPKNGYVFISRFMPRVEIVPKYKSLARRLYIRGKNGKIYPYLVINEPNSSARSEERFLQLQRLLNLYLCKHKETARRLLNFTVPRMVSAAIHVRIVEDNTSSLSLMDIYKQHVHRKGSDPDAPIAKYYDRFMTFQTNGQQPTPANLCEIVGNIQQTLAPSSLLKDWALKTFNSAADFWHFRKQFTLQLGLANFCEFAFHLVRLNPDMMYIHRDSGLLNVGFYQFDLIEESGELQTSKQQVPFRLTHGIKHFITDCGINGPMKATMIATASCFTHPNYKIRSVLCAILRDEIILWYKQAKSNEKISILSSLASQSNLTDDLDELSNCERQQMKLATVLGQSESAEIVGEKLVNLVTKAVNSIMSRLRSLAIFDGTESTVATLINAASNKDQLSLMDPAWHPWL